MLATANFSDLTAVGAALAHVDLGPYYLYKV